jgi:hypothetical protein
LRKLNGKVVLSRALRVRWAEENVKNDKLANVFKKKVESAQKKTVDVLRYYSFLFEFNLGFYQDLLRLLNALN